MKIKNGQLIGLDFFERQTVQKIINTIQKACPSNCENCNIDTLCWLATDLQTHVEYERLNDELIADKYDLKD